MLSPGSSTVTLDDDGLLDLAFELDDPGTHVLMEATLRSQAWVAVCVSETGDMLGADCFRAAETGDGHVGNGQCVIDSDGQMNADAVHAVPPSQADGQVAVTIETDRTTMRFIRPVANGTYAGALPVSTSGSTIITWAYGSTYSFSKHIASGSIDLDVASGAARHRDHGSVGLSLPASLPMVAFVLSVILCGGWLSRGSRGTSAFMMSTVAPPPTYKSRTCARACRSPVGQYMDRGACNVCVRLMSMDVVPATVALTWAQLTMTVVYAVANVITIALRISMLPDHISGPEAVARGIAAATAMNLGMVLLPVSRTAVWTRVLGISFERAVAFHRCVGRVIVVCAAWHGIDMARSGFTVDVMSFDPTSHGNGVAYGLVAAVCFGVAALLALEPVRRSSFELFYHTHFVNLLAIACAMLHANNLWWVMVPSVMLYCTDRIVRRMRSTRRPKVLEVTPLDGATRLRVRFPKGHRIGNRAGDYAFVCIGGIAPLQWHPFSISSAPSSADLVFIIKAMGKGTFTSALYERAKRYAESQAAADMAAGGVAGHVGDAFTGDNEDLAGLPTVDDVLDAARQDGGAALLAHHESSSSGDGTAVPGWGDVRVDGPYGSLSVRPELYKRIFCISGGVGVTPMASFLEWVLDDHIKAAREKELPRLERLTWVWCVQKSSQFSWLLPLLRRAHESDIVELRLYATRAKRPKSSPEFNLNTGGGDGGGGGGGGGEAKGGVDSMRSARFLSRTGASSAHLVGLPPFRPGHPKLKKLLVADSWDLSPGHGTAVFACGPEPLSLKAKSVCRDIGAHFHSETFAL